MTTQISVESISLTTHQNIPVITTELLAQLYGTEVIRIQQNHARNAERFIEGKHFFKLVGQELRELKHRLSLSESVKIARNVRSLILWTERGAARHAKMLETDQAWEVFEKLEDCYFSQTLPSPTRQVQPAVDMLNIDLLIKIRDGNVKDIRQVGPDMFVGKVEQILNGLRDSGWIVIKRDLLAEKLATW
ncbi:ORF6N domain-containing protein [Salmonella enterica subsp. enterica serovar Bredeney]|uniref:ORF6N domain-containing protein n=1 Tax=Salmonella montevideo TaxID=115981 RepID=A0A614ZY30_SALMO|nr:ORF6N domain-containing protein [Salmonella enterica]EBK1410476.1 ORF6N domain-containing protein [Salmonella enterica subsp. enterica serovar Montevideo]ECS2146590.1 ORF6N domain-containing protein [Salmonella enterica subsp. enterica serovar Cerro]ECS6617731.1 ORF6N domain-containing protein [Salmonella enterica subsp. enterica serovar Bredeney]ECX1628470.1 ORF6N domain-containing protein [Salmonella enterica subsp. enterica serovar Schwarzengrund]ECM7806951.1 ORF6N domain-containing prot